MQTEQRLCANKDFQISTSKAKFDENGFLEVSAVPTKVGVFEYMQPDGSILREFVSEEEVFNEASLETLKLKPCTLSHPDEFVNPFNNYKYIKGVVGEQIKRNDDKVVCNVKIYDKDSLENIFGNKGIFFSTGYTCDVERKEGIWNGEKYDAIQRNIKYNHLALLLPDEKPRFGDECRIRFNSLPKKTGVLLTPFLEKNMEKNIIIKKSIEEVKIGDFKLNSITVEENESTRELLSQREKVLDECKKLYDEKTVLQAQKDAIHSDNLALKEAVKNSISFEKVNSLVKEKSEIQAMLDSVGLKDVVKENSIEEWIVEAKKTLIKQKINSKDIEEKLNDSAYLNASFDHLCSEWNDMKRNIQAKVNLDIYKVKTENDNIDYSTKPVI